MRIQFLDRIRHSVFWKIASLLITVQLITVLLAIVLNVWLAYQRSLDLVTRSLILRMDSAAEEIEQRLQHAQSGTFPRSLQLDIARRFPDPVYWLDASGMVKGRFLPEEGFVPVTLSLPEGVVDSLQAGVLAVGLKGRSLEETWAVIPVYSPDDAALIGGLFVHPLTKSVQRELSGVWEAHQKALLWALLLVLGVAILTSAWLTARLVYPLRLIMQQVESIGQGKYSVQLPFSGDDELGRLAASIHRMAAQVEQSVETWRATDRLRRELIANIGHDLRTPLAALIGYLEEVRHMLGKGELEKARRALVTAERQAQYLQRLLQDLFELSVLNSPHPPLHQEPVPVAELIEDAVDRHRQAFENKGIQFRVQLSDNLPVLRADGMRLLRLLDNLLTNAREHTPSGGQVDLVAEVSDGVFRLRVRDTGSGIAPEEQRHIFERYYRGGGARTRKRNGTGLGLAIGQAIARAHGGELRVQSQLGKGSEFILELPLG